MGIGGNNLASARIAIFPLGRHYRTPAKLYNELGMSTVVGRELLEFLSTDVTAVELAKYIK